MKLYPAIDLKNGECVRLHKGDMSKATTFSDDPGAQARAFEEKGAEYIHIVDLDGAFAGEARNGDAVQAILSAIHIPVQLGGGIRNMDAVDYWLSKGIDRVILGTIATKNPEFVKEAARKYPGQIVVGIDARKGLVAVEGWAITSDLDYIELAQAFEDVGVAAIIYTDIDRDGAMEGPDVIGTAKLANAVQIPVIASGGVSSYDDLTSLKNADANLEGVITGRALYEGAIEMQKARELLES